jgi:uncharacterized protein Yka (UPF0111/DUF47 family)
MNSEEKILKMLESMQQGQNIIAKQVNELSEVQNNVNERIINTLERVEAKVDVLQLETAHLRRVK